MDLGIVYIFSAFRFDAGMYLWMKKDFCNNLQYYYRSPCRIKQECFSVEGIASTSHTDHKKLQ